MLLPNFASGIFTVSGLTLFVHFMFKILLAFYAVYAFLLIRQVSLMNTGYKTEFEKLFSFIAFAHFVFAAFLLVVALLII